MNRCCTFFFFSLTTLVVSAQPCPEYYSQEMLESNKLFVNIMNNGNLFNRDGESFFKIPWSGYGSPSTIRKAGLWIGGVDPGVNLKMAASAVDSERDLSDFTAGPLDPASGAPYENYPCGYFNQIWKVTKEEIIAHIRDYSDNQQIDNPVPAIMNWPGRGNPYIPMWPVVDTGMLKEGENWAPFIDQDRDKIYDPLKGDYPFPDVQTYDWYLPEVMYWTVFHDMTAHPLTKALPLRVEVQLTAWTRSCEQNEFVENTLFTRYRIINRAFEDIDSVYAGIWVDFELGCGEDDYLGSLPDQEAFFAYNMNNMDGGDAAICANDAIPYGKNPPAMAVSFPGYAPALNHFMYYLDESASLPGLGPPETDAEFYNYLTGRWKDGTPLTTGGTGFNPASTNYTSFAFSGNPDDSSKWTMYREQLPAAKRFAIGSAGLSSYGDGGFDPTLQPGDAIDLYVAFSYHRFPGINHLEIFDRMENYELHLMPEALQPNGGGVPSFCGKEWPWFYYEEVEPVPAPPGVYPNPANHFITVSFPGTETTEVALFNTTGQLVYSNMDTTGDFFQIDLQPFNPGMYFLRLRVNGHYWTEKIVVGPK